ncbi:LysR family transcriptional regulator [Clostridium tagluense]|uniref:LysR family transcriptional regulator n=1 Tax=Clostridium tagluense TaxID=360422 RepID=UPI001C0AEA0D|nr:LysR family transcriptional regulator [Clostridium tagluense]MBU3129947.1 LysR family transcriptional regulator [Clostridium tagluense]MCB2311964.1 LysR family transcriptional regulator [Clostridium tagluense]MCB2318125.1 LysR family transcriptional regulator [Clostridium tagluense]MCB2323338.1 LysR family transcriptional regulator [Clostridium tagluense]MCB2327909.1 LysR family transcriptional regulator [Clostridium tagluense]
MNIESMETFVILSENGNFTKTAELQYLVQSTISNRINELEKYVGKKLFVRNNKNVRLTKSGEAFLPYAKRMIMLKKDGIIKARSVGVYEDRLALGLVDSIYKGIISPIIKEYFLTFPSIAVKLKVNHSEEIIRLLGDGILDIGFVYTKFKSSKFEVIDFLEDEIILVTSPNNKIVIEEEIPYSDLIHLPLLYADLGEDFFEWLSKLFGNSPLLKLSVDEPSYVIDFVKEGFGYAFVTKSAVNNELKYGELIHVKIKDSIPPKRQIYMLINKNKKNSIAIKSWLGIINAR